MLFQGGGHSHVRSRSGINGDRACGQGCRRSGCRARQRAVPEKVPVKVLLELLEAGVATQTWIPFWMVEDAVLPGPLNLPVAPAVLCNCPACLEEGVRVEEVSNIYRSGNVVAHIPERCRLLGARPCVATTIHLR